MVAQNLEPIMMSACRSKDGFIFQDLSTDLPKNTAVLPPVHLDAVRMQPVIIIAADTHHAALQISQDLRPIISFPQRSVSFQIISVFGQVLSATGLF